jgi:hypothetical protein
MRENNLPCLLCVIALLSVCGCCGQQQQNHATGTDIHVRDLWERPVIGELGLPLGTAAEIRATIVTDETNSKGGEGRYFLRVTEVNGHILSKPKRFDFSVPSFPAVPLADNRLDLYAWKHGEASPGLTNNEFKKIDEGYVGRVVRLGVYETGEFSGIPNPLPTGVGGWQDHSFGFSTSLVVLVERQ